MGSDAVNHRGRVYRGRRVAQLVVCAAALAAAAVLVGLALYEDPASSEDQPGGTGAQAIGEISFLGGDSQLQEVGLFDTGGGYAAFLPADMRDHALLSLSHGETLHVEGNHDYHAGDELDDIETGTPYSAELRDGDGSALARFTLTFYQATNVPTLYVLTEDGTTEAIDADKNEKIDARFACVDTDGVTSAEGGCRLKTRGNTSFSVDQKSYNLKVDDEISPFGMEAATKWSLLANYGGSADYYTGVHQLMNKVTFDLAREIGLDGQPDSRFCNLYVDGEYRGLYLMVQRPTVGGSVDINDMDAEHEENGDVEADSQIVVDEDANGNASSHRTSLVSADDISGGYMLEKTIGAQSSKELGEDNKFWVSSDDLIVIKSPESLSDEEFAYVSTYVQGAVDALYDEGATTAQLEQYFDFDSWARYYLINDFTSNRDVNNTSFKFYKKRGDGRLYAGPAWDFDGAYGVIWRAKSPQQMQRSFVIEDRQSHWLYQLGQNDSFKDLVADIYRDELSPAIDEYMDREFVLLAARNWSSVEMTWVRWGRGELDYEQDVNDLYTWICGRKDFLDEYVADPDSFCRVTFDADGSLSMYYVKRGELLDYTPEVYAAETSSGEPVSYVMEDGSEFDPSRPVTQDMTIIVVPR